ncbi:hypothetical protein UG54_00315 [Gordonia sihwensis]|nr:hypothetical protein UG54_00315 [Gordonia sihwensis]
MAAAALSAELFTTTDYPVPAVSVGARAEIGVIVPDRFRLPDSALRQDISGYTGRLRAAPFVAAAVAVGSAAAAPSRIDLSGESTSEQIHIAQHLRGLHIGFQLRTAGVEEAGTLTAVADVLWRPERTSGPVTAALTVWEILPRVDAAILPPSVTAGIGELLEEHLPRPTLAGFQRLWRAALTGRPSPVTSPTALDWLALAGQWMDLHHQAFPDVALPSLGSDGTLGWSENPTRDPLGRHLASTLAVAAATINERAARLSALIADAAPPVGVGQTAASGAIGVGGALTSHRRLVSWREPTERDLKNRRTFTRGLVVAGHRSPSMAPTPIAYPAGRLNTRQLVARSAQWAAGLPVTAKPWTAMRSVPRTSTRLRLAVIIDASATMQRWAQTAAPLGWAAAHAVAEIGGQHTLWGFGGDAFPIVPAGVAPTKVPVVLDPGSGSAGAGTAIRSATAAIPGDGVGLIVVVTDGALPDESDVQDAVDDAVRVGFTVVWAMPDRGEGRVRPRQAHILERQTPAKVAETISDTAFSLLTGMNK